MVKTKPPRIKRRRRCVVYELLWRNTRERERVHTKKQIKIIIYLRGKISESFPIGHCKAIPPKMVIAIIDEICKREYPDVLAKTGPRA